MRKKMDTRCEDCDYWKRQSSHATTGYCKAVHEDGFPFHPEQDTITAEDFSCAYGRKKEREDRKS